MNSLEATDIRVSAVIGTARPGNYTSKAVHLVVDEIENHRNYSCEIIDPARLELPGPGADTSEDAQCLRETIGESIGVVLATPEYHGSFSSTIKLVIENLGFPSVLAGKPVALLGVAAGSIGAIKSLEALRGVCSHVGAIVLPGPVSVARVQEVFDEEGNCLDEAVEQQVRGLGTGLIGYIDRHVCPARSLEGMVRAGAV
jgi:NAD(P)H-dependent FMN reductase